MLREILLMSKTLAGHISSPDNEDNEFGFPARELLVLKQSFIHIFQRSLRKPNEKNMKHFSFGGKIYTRKQEIPFAHTPQRAAQVSSHAARTFSHRAAATANVCMSYT